MTQEDTFEIVGPVQARGMSASATIVIARQRQVSDTRYQGFHAIIMVHMVYFIWSIMVHGSYGSSFIMVHMVHHGSHMVHVIHMVHYGSCDTHAPLQSSWFMVEKNIHAKEAQED